MHTNAAIPQTDEMPLSDVFRECVERYLERTCMAPATFGRNAVNDPAFVLRLRRGECDARLSTADRVLSYIRANPPPPPPLPPWPTGGDGTGEGCQP